MTPHARCDTPIHRMPGFHGPATALSRPVLRYHGGKWRLAPWLLQHLPPHRVYVEPYGGAASVLMRKPRAYAEIYNDRWGFVVSRFRVLRDPVQAAQLACTLLLTPYARAEFECCTAETLTQCNDPIEQARLMLLRSWARFGSASVKGAHATGFRRNVGRRGTLPSHDWARYPALIETFTSRLQGVIIEQHDALEVIRYDDSLQTLYDELYVGWCPVTTPALADHGRPHTEVLSLNAAAARGVAQGGGESGVQRWQETCTSPSTKASSCQERGHD